MGWGYWRNEKERFAANCMFNVTCENGHTQELSVMGLKKRLVEGFLRETSLLRRMRHEIQEGHVADSGTSAKRCKN